VILLVHGGQPLLLRQRRQMCVSVSRYVLFNAHIVADEKVGIRGLTRVMDIAAKKENQVRQ
jgi:hypothetical protein